MSDLTPVQKAAILGCSKQPKGMFKPRRVVTNALVRRGYAFELRDGSIELTAKGKRFAETGEQS